MTCFVPFPPGHVAGLIAWAGAVCGFLNLPAGRATVLAASVVSRLLVPGVLTAL